MNALDAARRIAGRFDEDGIPNAIGGALALGVWGVPRATKDVDVTAFVEEDRLTAVLDSLERAGSWRTGATQRATSPAWACSSGASAGSSSRCSSRSTRSTESLFAVRPGLDVAYVRGWLELLADLVRRFVT